MPNVSRPDPRIAAVQEFLADERQAGRLVFGMEDVFIHTLLAKADSVKPTSGESTYVSPRNCGLLLRWAIQHYGNITKALDMAEAVAVYLLASDEAWRERGETVAEHMPFYRNFVQRTRSERHVGDCSVAAAWLQAPVTCSACAYEEYVVRALQWLHVENVDLGKLLHTY